MVSGCDVYVCAGNRSVVCTEKRCFYPEDEAPEKPTERGLRRFWRILTYFGLVCGVMTSVTSRSKLVWIVRVMCIFMRTIRVLFVPKTVFLSRE